MCWRIIWACVGIPLSGWMGLLGIKSGRLLYGGLMAVGVGRWECVWVGVGVVGVV